MTAQNLSDQTSYQLPDTARIVFMLQLTDALTASHTRQQAGEALCHRLAAHLQVCEACFLSVTQDRRGIVMEARRESGLTPIPLSADGMQPLLRPLLAGQPFIADNAQELGILIRPDPALAAANFIHACMAFPIATTPERVYCILLFDGQPRSWTEKEVSLVHEAAHRAGQALHRIETEEALREARDREANMDALRDSEHRLQLAISACNMGAFEWFSDAHRLVLSEESRNILGLIAGEDIPTSDAGFSIVHPDDRAGHQQLFEHASKNGEDYHTLFRIIRPTDGKMAWIEEFGRGYKDRATGSSRMVGIHWDVTSRIVAEQQMKDLLLLREEFIGNAGHELKTPLTSIIAYGQILKAKFEEWGDQTSSGLMEKLNNQVDRLHGLISDLLDSTRLATGKLPIRKQLFDLNALTVERTEELQRTTARHSLVLWLGAIPSVSADREKIGQVIINLLSNAIKYSPNGGSIVIATSVSLEGVELSVKDTGLGIPQQDVEKIFDRYFRVNTPDMKGYSGMGIGLHVCAEIVHRHGGTISVESKLGEGSTFRFTLPL